MANPLGTILTSLTGAAPVVNSASASNATGTSSTPSIDNFFGLDSRFLKSPAGGTALFNNVLYGTSNQQVPVDFLGMGYYTGVPPIFGGEGFTGLPARFDMFSSQAGPVGVDAVLGLEQLIRSGGSTLSNAATSADSSKDATKVKVDKDSISIETLKKMTLGDLLKLLSSK
jgi:hypothetical protein